MPAPRANSDKEKPAPGPWELLKLSWRASGSCLSCSVAIIGLLFGLSSLFMFIDGCGR